MEEEAVNKCQTCGDATYNDGECPACVALRIAKPSPVRMADAHAAAIAHVAEGNLVHVRDVKTNKVVTFDASNPPVRYRVGDPDAQVIFCVRR